MKTKIDSLTGIERILIIGGILLSILSISGIVFLAATIGDVAQPPPAKLELLKFLLQVVLVVILGTVASLLVAEFNRQRKNADEKIEKDRQHLQNVNRFRREILSQMYRLYSDTKKTRRLLRAKARIQVTDNATQLTTTRVRRDIYDEQMQAINEIQLNLEILKQEVKTVKDTASDAFSDPENLRQIIGAMEEYLGDLVGEYEKKFNRFAGDPPTLPLVKLEFLKDFIDRGKSTRFRTEYIEKFYPLLRSIREDILLSTSAAQEEHHQLPLKV